MYFYCLFSYPRTFNDGEWDECYVGFDYAGVNYSRMGDANLMDSVVGCDIIREYIEQVK